MQKIFDLNVKKDEELLWYILPEEIVKLELYKTSKEVWCISAKNEAFYDISDIFKIYWGGRTKIYRPVKEATEADIGKLCRFWNDKSEEFFGRLGHIGSKYFTMIAPVYEDLQFLHCRRLTKQEIEELC